MTAGDVIAVEWLVNRVVEAEKLLREAKGHFDTLGASWPGFDAYRAKYGEPT